LNEELAGLFCGENGAYVESLYEDYVLGRERVPVSWRRIFDALHGVGTPPGPQKTNGLDLAAPQPVAAPAVPPVPAVGIIGPIDAYRSHGHLVAKLDPLGNFLTAHPLLEPEVFGLRDEHMQRRVTFGNYQGGTAEGTVPELIASLRRTSAGTFAAEFMEIRDKVRRDWLLAHMEPRENRPS
jgi:2-oxoglutarate dehydrogenase E1 component